MKHHVVVMLLSTFLLLLTSSFITHTTYAHPGGGPPFLKINGIYADTDPFSPLLEDVTSTVFTTSDTIHFEIDTPRLGIPEDVIKESEFMWTFDDGTATASGTSMSKQFRTTGSRVIKLEVKAPNDPRFFTLDTIRVSIAPTSTYKIPQVKVRVITSDTQSNTPITFEPLVTTEQGTTVKSYVWTLGDGNIKREKDVTHTYTGANYSYLVSVRVTDSNGFINYGGVVVTALDNKRVFEDPFTKGTSFELASSVDSSTNTKTSSVDMRIVLVSSVLLLGIITSTMFIYKKKRK